MATKKPRLTITLEPDQYDAVSDVARLRSVSKSTVVTEMLGASVPALQRVAKLLEALESARSGGYVDEFAANLQEAERTLAPLLAAALEQMDLPIEASHSPPSSNTGVTSPAGGSHKPRDVPPKPSNGAARKASKASKTGRADQGGKSHDV